MITTGTFLRGMIHIGKTKYPAGRHRRDRCRLSSCCSPRCFNVFWCVPRAVVCSADVEPPSVGLALTLQRLGFPMSRLTTGTPPRLDGNTIDYSQLPQQPSDDPVVAFSYMNDLCRVGMTDKLVPCHITHTNKRTHDIIKANMAHLPTFEANAGKGMGPLYCPSIL